MKNHSKPFALSALLLCGLLASCGGGGGTSSPSMPSVGPQSAPSSASSVPESDTQKAMKNFYNKIKDGNYTVTSPRAVASVYSRDILMVKYDPSIEGAKDEGVMSVDNETFKVNIETTAPIANYIQFVDQGRAIDVIGAFLPNFWFAGGNVWDYWQHDDAKPAFEYFSTNDAVKRAVGQYFVLGELEALSVSNMKLVFDSVAVNTAQITAKYIDGAGTSEMRPIDISIDISFGNVAYDQRLLDWTGDPNRKYPANIGDVGNWGTLIDTLLASELATSDFKTFAPVMPFASYAVICNDETFLTDGFVKIHDYHAVEKNVGDYIALLENDAFYKVTIDGQDWYRKHMRTKSDNSIFEVFSDLRVFYDKNGVTLLINAYYNRQILHGFEPLNNMIEAKGFPKLDSTVALTGYDIFNSPFEGQESKVYFYNYDMMVIGTFTYEDGNAFKTYVDNYSQALEAAGFTRGPDKNMVVYSKADTAVERKIIMETIDDHTSKFFISNEVYIDPAKAIADVNDAGFPTMTTDHIVCVQDHTVNQYQSHGDKWNVYYSMDLKFDSGADAAKAGSDYLKALEDSEDFIKNEQESGSRQGVYDSKDRKLKVSVDWKNGDKGLYFWFGINK